MGPGRAQTREAPLTRNATRSAGGDEFDVKHLQSAGGGLGHLRARGRRGGRRAQISSAPPVSSSGVSARGNNAAPFSVVGCHTTARRSSPSPSPRRCRRASRAPPRPARAAAWTSPGGSRTRSARWRCRAKIDLANVTEASVRKLTKRSSWASSATSSRWRPGDRERERRFEAATATAKARRAREAAGRAARATSERRTPRPRRSGVESRGDSHPAPLPRPRGAPPPRPPPHRPPFLRRTSRGARTRPRRPPAATPPPS